MIRNLKGRKNDGDLTVREALIIGLGQAVALIPGISRSGATIVAGMLTGLKQETALRFSFLLLYPCPSGGNRAGERGHHASHKEFRHACPVHGGLFCLSGGVVLFTEMVDERDEAGQPDDFCRLLLHRGSFGADLFVKPFNGFFFLWRFVFLILRWTDQLQLDIVKEDQL